jgi:hydroxylamine reductase (hybrid-cluster protein)
VSDTEIRLLPSRLKTGNCVLQCEQTKNGVGCTTIGVCGKTPEVANMQDLLMYQLKGLSCWSHLGRQYGALAKDCIFRYIKREIHHQKMSFPTVIHI